MYLESFRLPGEAAVISYLLEHFADHWHVSLILHLLLEQKSHVTSALSLPVFLKEQTENLLILLLL